MFKYFDLDEFTCSHTGENDMSETFISNLDHLREQCGFPFTITSGYRAVNHPEEAHKDKPGFHTLGVAADIAVSGGAQRRKLVDCAVGAEFDGIGIAKSFIHVDMRTLVEPEWEKMLWTY